MRTNALAVANYFIEIAKRENKPIRPLGLMKRVYIAHGFSLALYNKSILDERFDGVVEAWRYGPVIPSVYHSFKHYGGNPISAPTQIMEWGCQSDEDVKLVTPKLEDKDVKKVCEIVWKRYSQCTDADLVDLLHTRGAPWDLSYRPGLNNPIPDKMTKLFYEIIIEDNERMYRERQRERAN